MSKQGGIKHDGEKEPMALFSSIWLRGVSRVLGFGARKYAADNWRDGIAYRRLISACLRHVTSFMEGEDLDPETGLSHLDHASCCLMFLREMTVIRPDLDDRFKGVKMATYKKPKKPKKKK